MKGACVLTKSVNVDRLKSNLESSQITMTEEQELRLDSLNRNYRFGLGWLKGHYFPES